MDMVVASSVERFYFGLIYLTINLIFDLLLVKSASTIVLVCEPDFVISLIKLHQKKNIYIRAFSKL